MITKLNMLGGVSFAPGIPKNFTIASLALRRGALVSKGIATNNLTIYTQTTNGQTNMALAANTAVVLPPLGITNGSRLTTDTQASVELIASGELLEIDVTEIVNQTAITATGGSATTFVCSTLTGMSNGGLIGAVVKVLSMDSGNQAVNTLLTVTNYTNSTGTLTFASLGSTGFASGDTIQIMSLNNDYVAGQCGLYLNSTYADSIDLMNPMYSNAEACLFRVIGTNSDQGMNPGTGSPSVNGSRLQVVILKGYDQDATYGIAQ